MSTTTLKLIASLFMLIDHIGQFIPNTPILLRWIGRLSAPIFLFCSVYGFHYTKNRKKYLKNLYIFSLICSLFFTFLNSCFDTVAKSYISNNIFSSLFLIFLIVYIIDTCNQNKRNKFLALGVFFLYNTLSLYLQILLIDQNNIRALSLNGIIPNIFTTEGGITLICLGVLMYYSKESKLNLSITLLVFSLLYALSAPLNISNLLYVTFQWMMIFSLIFMFMYNGKKGSGYKCFFYIFYPLHISLLFLFSAIFY